jgi:hypothetical protein
LAGAPLREPEAHGASIVGVRAAGYEAGGLGAIDQPDRAVVAQQQVVGDVADRRPARVRMTADREEELVLCGSEPGRARLLLAPAQEPAQARAKLQQPPVVVVAELSTG